MRHGWPFGAQSDDSPRRCAANDQPRLLTDVVGALIDRAPIDWSALRARVRHRQDASVIESLRAIEAIRRQAAPTRRRERLPSSLAARGIAILAAAQTAVGLFAVATAASNGVNAGGRSKQMAVALAFAAAAILLGSRASRDPRRLHLLATFLIAASTFTRGMLRSLTTNGADLSDLLPAAVLIRGISLEAFVPACLWEFALDFPRVRRFARFDIWARRIAASLWLLGTIVLILNVASAYGLTLHLGDLSLLADTTGSAFWRALCLAVLPAMAAIFIRSRRAPYPERVKVARFALAFVAGSLPFLVLGLVRTLAPTFDAWLLTAHPRDRLWLDVLVIAGLMAAPILGTTAVIVDRPFELRAAVWRFYRARSLSAHRLARAVERMSVACGPRDTTFALERELRSGIGATRTRVMVPGADGAFVDRTRDVTPLPSSSALRAIIEDENVVDLTPAGPIVDLLPTGDREWVATNDVEMLAPLRDRAGRITALVAIGPQRGGQPYGADDRTLVSALVAAATLAWESDRTTRRSTLEQPAYECERCGVVQDSPVRVCGCEGEITVAAVPKRLGAKFAVDRRIGRGGAGVVYLARDAAIGRNVALKTLPTIRRGMTQRLSEEAQTMGALRHEGLATIYGLEAWRGVSILVIEYFPKGTLAQRLAHGPLTHAETIALGIALADTLSYLHTRGLLHRDLKPSNIALSAAGQPVLLDFGLATWFESDGNRTTAGTPAYLPPEAFQGASASPAFDLWALAVVLIECLSGTNPFAGEDRSDTLRRIHGLDPNPTFHAISINTPALAKALARALDRDARQRFPTANDVRQVLETAQHS